VDESVQKLLDDLKSPDQLTRDQATQALWQNWFAQKGALGLQRLNVAQQLIEVAQYSQAKAVLDQLILDMPDFAEAWNRRAVLHFVQYQYQAAIDDCLEVIRLNPVHFGALHGLGFCYAALEDYRAAIQYFREALLIQPYSLANQRLMLECTARLN
jgi:tetratricopeptide (TPR) repeat protein